MGDSGAGRIDVLNQPSGETLAHQRLIVSQRPDADNRRTSLNPFETKRKKAQILASSQDLGGWMAEKVGFEPTMS